MHQTLTYQVKQNLLFRVLPLFFAAIMLLSGAPVMVQFFREQLQELVSDAPKKEPPLSEHALGVTLDGSAAGSFVLQSYEKKTLTAANLKGKATYQWQIRHPEKDVWINIYDATDKELPVSAALVKNMLNAQGNASLRCRAYTKDYTYLSNAISVKLADLGSSAPNTGDSGSTDGAGSGAPLGSGSPVADDGDEGEKEFVTITIEYELFGYVKQSDGTMKEVSLGQAFTSYVAMLQYGSSLEAANGKIHSPDIVGFKPKLVAGYDSEGNSVLTVKENDAQGNPIYNEEILETNGDHFVNIAQNEVTKDITYEVQYHPAMVDYEVRYFFQNIYDDLYVEDDTILDEDSQKAETIRTQGETGSEPPASHTERVFPGFTSLYYQPEAIAADGSTVFQVFYERDYYLMEFDCNGGYGADTIYVRYGTYISVPNPVRSGYVFGIDGSGKGWDLIKTDEVFDDPEQAPNLGTQDPVTGLWSGDGVFDALPTTMPPYNSAYKAIWDTAATTYTVVYWRENANDGNFSYWGSAQIGLGADGQPDGSVRSASYVSGVDNVPNSVTITKINGAEVNERPYFTYNDDFSDKNVVVMGDGSTVVNVYYTRNVYTLTLTDGENSAPDQCQVEEHTHTDACYAYACKGHTHSKDCYKCGLIEHVHNEECCSLYHVHSAECGYACGQEEHTAHQRSCYTFTGGNVSNSSTNANYVSKYGTYGDVDVYKSTYSNNYYVLIGGKYYSITNFNNNTFRGTLICHQHSEACGYACGQTAHTHEEGTCNLAQCPNGGAAYEHTAACYVCGLDEKNHDETCCSLEVHNHTTSNCAAGKCIHTKHEVSCYTSNTLTKATNQTGYTTIASIANPQEAKIYRYCQYNYNGYYHNYIYINGVWYYLGTSNRATATVGGFTWANNANTNATNTPGQYSVSSVSNQVSKCTHTHIDQCYSCNKKNHTHDLVTCNILNCSNQMHHQHAADCYVCGEGHVHISSCPKGLVCTLAEHIHSADDSKFSDTIVKVIQAKYGAYIGDEWVFTTPDGTRYPAEGKASSWDPQDNNSGLSERLALIDIMPGDNFELKNYPQDNPVRYYNYYIECLPGEEADTTFEGIKYKHYLTDGTLVVDFNQYTKAEDFFPIAGFAAYKVMNGNNSLTGNSAQLSSGATLNFYYKRMEYTLQYFNYLEKLKDTEDNVITHTLKYQAPLAPYEISKEEMQQKYYPSTLEPGAYEFAGWYYTNGCYDGTEVAWNSDTMPNQVLELSAKWVPIQRDVYFYHLYSDIASNKTWDTTDVNGNAVTYPIKVDHGTLLGTTYSFTPQRDGYDFVGWFYMDQDNKKKFAPDSMEIRRDLHLFAEWHSKTDTTYEITYTLAEDTIIGKTTYEAGTVLGEPTTGHASAGKTKTFTAKDRGQLNSPFNSDEMSLFPTLNSHSILMSENSADNTFNFTYVYDAEVFYKIRYVDKTTNVDLRKPQVVRTNMAIVTEKFLPIPEYIPEQYYIRKVLAADGKEGSEDNVLPANEIIFYYIPDSEHALYTIEYYKETLEDGVYELVQSAVGSDKLGQNIQVSIDANKYNGFTYGYTTVTKYDQNPSGEMNTVDTKPDASGKVDISAPLTVHGVEIRVYYTRNSYPYVIKFMQTGTTDVLGYGLLNPDGTVMMKDGSPVFTLDEINAAKPMEKFEYTISYTPAGSFKIGENEYRLDGYDPEHPENSAKSLKIRQETGDYEDLVDNDLVFWYSQRQVTVYYQAVCTVPGATQFGGVTFSRETQPAATLLAGSAAKAGNGYKFLGWFDELGNQVTEDGWVTETPAGSGTYHLKPKAFNDHNNDDEVYYYARFAPISASLVIENEVDAGSCMHNFVIRLQGQGKLEYVDLTFVITGTGSVTIEEAPVGSYSVTKTLWGWEHTPKTETVNVTVAVDTENRVTFQNICTDSNWLEGEAKR